MYLNLNPFSNQRTKQREKGDRQTTAYEQTDPKKCLFEKMASDLFLFTDMPLFFKYIFVEKNKIFFHFLFCP